MQLSIVVNLSSTVNGTQSALQATSPLGPWFQLVENYDDPVYSAAERLTGVRLSVRLFVTTTFFELSRFLTIDIL